MHVWVGSIYSGILGPGSPSGGFPLSIVVPYIGMGMYAKVSVSVSAMFGFKIVSF